MFDKGKKNGIFKIFELSKIKENNEIKEKLVFIKEFVNNCEIQKLIEKKQYLVNQSNNKIFCMEIFEDHDNLYLL